MRPARFLHRAPHLAAVLAVATISPASADWHHHRIGGRGEARPDRWALYRRFYPGHAAACHRGRSCRTPTCLSRPPAWLLWPAPRLRPARILWPAKTASVRLLRPPASLCAATRLRPSGAELRSPHRAMRTPQGYVVRRKVMAGRRVMPRNKAMALRRDTGRLQGSPDDGPPQGY